MKIPKKQVNSSKKAIFQLKIKTFKNLRIFMKILKK